MLYILLSRLMFLNSELLQSVSNSALSALEKDKNIQKYKM